MTSPTTPPPAPSLSEGWSIGEAAFAALVHDARAIEPQTIVEFGGGASSVRLAQAFPGASLLSIESSPEFLERTRALAAAHGMDPTRLRTDLRPLRVQRHGVGLYESYDRGDFPAAVDMAVIDGPPGRTKRGREACLYQVAAALRVGARVYLDDYERHAEQRVVRNWLRVFRGQVVAREIRVGHGLYVLEVAAPLRPRFGIRVGLDACQAHLRRRWELARGRG